MILKFSFEYQGLKLYKFYVNDDFNFNLTYLTIMTNFAKLAFCALFYARHQLSFYKTIGPLVLLANIPIF